MNDTLKVLETRRSCRNFDPAKPVSDEAVQAIVKAGTYAPTGRGLQSPIIIAVSNKKLRDEISAENARIMGVDCDPFYGAPVILIVLAIKIFQPTYMTVHLLWEIFLMQLKALESTVYGFIGQRKNLNPGSVKIFLKNLALRATTRVSDTVQSDTQPNL